MLPVKRLFTMLLLVTLILSACQPIQSAEKLLAPAPVGQGIFGSSSLSLGLR